MSVEVLTDPANPLGDGEQLWRYMKLSTLLLLLEGMAFFPSVATLRSGDQFEGISSVDAPWIFSALRNIRGRDALAELYPWLRSKAAQHEKSILEAEASNGPAKDAIWGRIFASELAKRRSVWCWFGSAIESAAMWPIYGGNGVAVGTTVGALRQALPDEQDFQIARIRYMGTDPRLGIGLNPEHLNNRELIHRPHLVKRREYTFEQEVRVVTLCPGDERGVLVNSINQRELLKEIVISPLVPREEADAIKRVILERDWESEPEIERSSLLEDNSFSDDESAARDNELVRLLGSHERGIPSLLATL